MTIFPILKVAFLGEKWTVDEYNLKDHLGNNRITFTDKNNDGIIQFDDNNDLINEIISEKHYYPFGLAHKGPWYTSPSPTKYTYNGKEFNDDFGLDWSDYGARWYDSTVGRWWSVDPLADQMPAYSPYNYAFNNPISYTDPDGRSPEDWIKMNGVYQYDENVTNQAQVAEKYGAAAEYIGEIHQYRDYYGDNVQLNKNGTWNYTSELFGTMVKTMGRHSNCPNGTKWLYEKQQQI